jgi:PBP4 family serine-type D-alanyl-D-alanine carboxypeptidase
MRVAVLGAAGFIGSHLVDRLLRDGWEVVGVDNLSTGTPANLYAAFTEPGFRFIEADVCDRIPIEEKLDAVLHFASPASPKDYARLSRETLRVNSVGTDRACDLVQRDRAVLVYASTSEVYGEPLVHPQPESYFGNVNTIGPRACYDEAKRFGEALVATRWRKEGLDVRIVRIFNTYGPRMRPDDGRVIPNFISAALRGEPLTIYGDGTQTRAFCYVDDLVDGIVRVLQVRNGRGTVVNLGNPVETPVADLAAMIAEIAGVDLRTAEEPLPLDDPSRRCPDIHKARAFLGWEPRIALREGLEKTLAAFRLAALMVAVILACVGGPASAADRTWSPAEIASLRMDVDALLARSATVAGAHVGVLVEDTGNGRTLYDRHAGEAFQPASTLKLLTGSVALDRLGAAYRFTTTVSFAGDQLVVRGGGDPLLTAADLDDAAEAVRRAGVTAASVVIDESHVAPSERRPPGWSVDDVLQDYAPVIDGLPFEENVLHARLHPGAEVGAPPVVEVPAPFVARVDSGGPCTGGPTLLSFTLRARTVAAGEPATADVEKGACGDIVVTGDVPLGAPVPLDVAVEQPEALALIAFTDGLGRRGIEVRPPPASPGPIPGVVAEPFSTVPPGTVIWRRDGEPLSALLGAMWGPSDNLIAEQLLRELDVAANVRAGIAAGAVVLEQAWLGRLGIDPATATLVDGSGLSQYDRITPRALAAILAYDWSGANRSVVLDALPVAGVSGTLRDRMRGTPAEGHVFAKTGTMSHVRSLAGFVATRSHGTLIFVLMVDDWLGDDTALAAFQAAFCSRLVQN